MIRTNTQYEDDDGDGDGDGDVDKSEDEEEEQDICETGEKGDKGEKHENHEPEYEVEYFCNKHAKLSKYKVPSPELNSKKIRKMKLVDIKEQEIAAQLLEKQNQKASKQKKAKKVEKIINDDENGANPQSKVEIFKNLIENQFNGDYTITGEKITFLSKAMGISSRNATRRLERALEKQEKVIDNE
jgi:hypothetical protein